MKIYLDSSQFNRNLNIRNLWNQTKDEEDPSLTGIQEDILIFILNMYCCQKNKQKRAMKITKIYILPSFSKYVERFIAESGTNVV